MKGLGLQVDARASRFNASHAASPQWRRRLLFRFVQPLSVYSGPRDCVNVGLTYSGKLARSALLGYKITRLQDQHNYIPSSYM